jgi:hypothetical protein
VYLCPPRDALFFLQYRSHLKILGARWMSFIMRNRSFKAPFYRILCHRQPGARDLFTISLSLSLTHTYTHTRTPPPHTHIYTCIYPVPTQCFLQINIQYFRKLKTEVFVLPQQCSASIYYLRFGTECRSHL